MPERQAELFSMVKKGVVTITGEGAIAMARKMKGATTSCIFKVSYQSKEELIGKLELALRELQHPQREGVTQVTPM
jgi:hypothetical protein